MVKSAKFHSIPEHKPEKWIKIVKVGLQDSGLVLVDNEKWY